MEIEMIEFGTLPEFNTFEKRSMLNELLQSNICLVKFTKIDGSERQMVCTLKNDLLPIKLTEFTSKKRLSEEAGVLPVYSLENKGWRSFKIDNVISIEVYDAA